MANPAPRPAAHFEVDDPSVAFGKLEAFTRRVLAVPKKKIDAKLAAAKKSAKKNAKRHQS